MISRERIAELRKLVADYEEAIKHRDRHGCEGSCTCDVVARARWQLESSAKIVLPALLDELERLHSEVRALKHGFLHSVVAGPVGDRRSKDNEILSERKRDKAEKENARLRAALDILLDDESGDLDFVKFRARRALEGGE